VRVIGIDPGLAATGYAVVERGRRPAAVSVGIVRTTPGPPQARLVLLRARLGEIMAAHRPDAAAIERLFFNANVRTAMAVGQASGVALLASAEHGLPVSTYTPLEVKQAVAGFGGASKRQVGEMVERLLGLPGPPRPPDAADACALAICHLTRAGLRQAISEATA
jgi:crossover junction endodeoxyribonuclease RuvC